MPDAGRNGCRYAVGVKAVVYDRYGSVDELCIEERPVPSPGRGEVLVEVRATSVNLSDWEALRGSPAYARIDGLFSPRRHVLGSDIAGTIAAVGEGVTRFGVGDEVYGDILFRKGGFAEFAIAPVEALALKPAALSFAEASTIPQAGAISLQAVARAKAGERMLINGAGGGSGMFAIQLARAAGIEVTAVDTAAKADFMLSLGARDVIDYRTRDWTRTGPYDVVIDLVASRSVFAVRRALARGGRYLIVGGTGRALVRVLTAGTILGALTGARLGILAVAQGPAHFAPLAERCASGEIRVHIDSEYPLDATAAAMLWHTSGESCGKVVVVAR